MYIKIRCKKIYQCFKNNSSGVSICLVIKEIRDYNLNTSLKDLEYILSQKQRYLQRHIAPSFFLTI